jgi:hypothetical protein
MADIEDEHRTSTHRALALRDVIGAWLICGVIAAMALAFSGDRHAPPASAPLESALAIPHDHAGYGTKCAFPARPDRLCTASANNARRALSHPCCQQALWRRLGDDHPYVSGFATTSAFHCRRDSADPLWPNRRHQLQPRQQQVDVKEDNNRRERDRRNQVILDRLYLRNSTSIVTA